MADYNLKDDLLGFGRSQLKYMLFHNSTLADLDEYSYRKGLFFYDTDLDSLEFIKDNLTGWHSAISMVSSNNPSFVSDNDIADRFLIGTKDYSVARGFNPGVAGFLVIDGNGYPTSQTKILFEDIESTDYTTVITAPGLDTRFATEKAIVDYVTAATFSAQDNILDWDGTKYAPYSAKIGSNPGYAYFFTGTTTFPSYNNVLNIDAYLRTANIQVRQGNVQYSIIDPTYFSVTNSGYTNKFEVDTIDIQGRIFGTVISNSRSLPIRIGSKSIVGAENAESILIDDYNQLFNIDMTTVRLNKGTAEKYLYLDANKNITYVDAPSGGVTPTDDILNWDTDAYTPYTSKTASALYTGITAPNAVATVLNYDGILRATQLYEGATRVMTTHGSWAANGSLHAVTTSSHAGFCPQLPVFSPAIDRQFLRADGTWVNIDIDSAWTRDEGELAVVPSTVTDAVMIRSTSNLGTLTIGELNTDESIVFGIPDLGDNETVTSQIKWFTNGTEQGDVLYLGVYGTGVSSIARLGADLTSFDLIAPTFNINTTNWYSNAAISRIQRNYAGVVSSRVFNECISDPDNSAATFIAGVNPSTSDYATLNFTVTSKSYVGTADWLDNGTDYLKHSANIVTGGIVKPALNIGTREGKPIRFFVGGDGDLNFDNSTLRAVINKDGNISLGNHALISTNVAKYVLDLLSGDIRLLTGKLLFGGSIGNADATVNLYKNISDELVTDGVFKAIGGYKSSDGSTGLTTSGSFDTSTTRVISITVKNGLITAFSITGGA